MLIKNGGGVRAAERMPAPIVQRFDLCHKYILYLYLYLYLWVFFLRS